MKQLFYITFLFLIFSCRKDVKLDLPDYKQKVVVEASIEAGGTAIVFLSYSVPYFGEFDYSAPQKAFIKGAFVTVTDGSFTDTLKEVDPNTGYFYLGTKLLGQQGKTYTLRVTVADKTFETSTTILNPPKLDSLFFIPADRDSMGFIGQTFSEPAGSGDYYRWFAKRINRDQFYAPPFNSVFDDKFVDGTVFDFSYNRGPQPNLLQPNSEDPERGYYKRGDAVAVKFCRIGKREYDFWLTYYQNKSSNGNPFSAPANVKSMFTDYENVFGAFVGYAPFFDTLNIPYE